MSNRTQLKNKFRTGSHYRTHNCRTKENSSYWLHKDVFSSLKRIFNDLPGIVIHIGKLLICEWGPCCTENLHCWVFMSRFIMLIRPFILWSILFSFRNRSFITKSRTIQSSMKRRKTFYIYIYIFILKLSILSMNYCQ